MDTNHQTDDHRILSVRSSHQRAAFSNMSAARPNRPGTFCLGSASPGAAGTKRHASPAQLTSQAICDLEEFADAQLRDAQAVGHLRWDHHLAGLDGPRRETEPSGWISRGEPRGFFPFLRLCHGFLRFLACYLCYGSPSAIALPSATRCSRFSESEVSSVKNSARSL